MPETALHPLTEGDMKWAYKLFIHKRRHNPSFKQFEEKMKGSKCYVINFYEGFVFLAENNEIGYYIINEQQNKGRATEAVKLIMNRHRRPYYFATIRNDNPASKRVVQKIGFRPKGTLYGFNPSPSS